jgi:hypothetical protein
VVLQQPAVRMKRRGWLMFVTDDTLPAMLDGFHWIVILVPWFLWLGKFVWITNIRYWELTNYPPVQTIYKLMLKLVDHFPQPPSPSPHWFSGDGRRSH